MNTLMRQFLRHDTHPAIQFIKYSICGGIATAVFIVASFIISWLLIPALQTNDPLLKFVPITVTPVTEDVRAIRFVVNSILAFMLANLVAYITNVLWVFKPGRHSRWMELALFYAGSGFSFGVGTIIGWALIHFSGASTSAATVSDVVVSALINYATRKFVIFKG